MDYEIGTMEGMSKKVSNDINIALSVPVTQYNLCFGFLNSRIKQHDFFNATYKYNFIPIIGDWFYTDEINGINGITKTWFCSQLIGTALQKGGIIDKNINTRYVTPQILYDLVISHPNKVLTKKFDLKIENHKNLKEVVIEK